MSELSIETTPVPGLLVLTLPLHQDARGWFKENWQRAKMVALGLPDFGPVQNNMSYNEEVGVTRGLHAEPWDKLIGLAQGRIFGAWVDLRPGDSFGASFSLEMGPDKAVFVPRGVANGYQALAPHTTYSYLVNDHWSPEARASYTYLNLADETASVPWPIPVEQAIISDADLAHPRLAEVVPMRPPATVILGASGQLGRALQAMLPDARAVDQAELDLTDAAAVADFGWQGVGTVINAAAWTAVDAAETPEGRRAAWRVNVDAVRHLVDAAGEHGFTLVHVSSDYVFDGEATTHAEDEPFSPLGVYGATKAAGDALVATLPRHYIVRTSWVIGDGGNFVRTMARLAADGVAPSVVDDQIGRLTFTDDLAAGIVHLIDSGAGFGTYNLTNEGPPASWFEVARRVFELTGHDPASVSPQSTAEFAAGRVVSPRPRHSTLELAKIRATGFRPRDADAALVDYLR
ncbi:sugar nucleotide-binding protein [Propioniciclava coleopterorum]|uniref:dTDP-4-dehydrorhamnose reductase n=1 Tax=Propioniciclava coleopterorum TaxID=2714937 RepID=A0A6G7Y773_9ACTN|nr:bifunctional dTDP-4-dehydrorhamnose 3,5-epimerase family protein/NAD(P)-dependent oxidoreductase [Propioniciclava coleopterorum]QIK72665.1 sugar nucleotide-binding protein [Propioniciclava coleopterorum]